MAIFFMFLQSNSIAAPKPELATMRQKSLIRAINGEAFSSVNSSLNL